MKKLPGLILVLLCIAHSPLIAQDKLNLKYGKITPADFDLSKYKFDTSVSAVVIADVGESDFEGNTKSGISLTFKKQARIKILNKNGFEAANQFILLYFSNNNEEKLLNLKGTTYNLENGKVVETDMDKKSVFKEKYDKNHMIVRFTLPALAEGSIIEFSYTQTSDFIHNLQPWEFQGKYPVLWSQYEVTIPDFYNYVFLSQGTVKLDHTTSSSRKEFRISNSSSTTGSGSFTVPANTVRHKWVAQNCPALKTESFTTSIQNHISKIEFQLSQVRYPDQPVQDIMGNWEKLATDLMKSDYFGNGIVKSNGWLNDELQPVVLNVNDKLDKAKKIYSYVRDRFTCNGRRGIYLSESLRTIDKNKSGYVADINMLLIAMLKQQDIEAYPIILSTRSHGFTNEFYPLIDRFNYVICAAKVDDHIYFLDASDPTLGFNKLPGECYNGHARLILPGVAQSLYFSPDSLIEKKLTSVFLRSSKPGEIEGHFASNLGYYESIGIRTNIKSKGESSFFKSLQTGYSGDIALSKEKVDMLTEFEKPVKVEYDFVIKQEDDMVYFNPMMNEGYKGNYFKSAERFYPVEMPYCFDETYIFSMEVPQDYTLEEIPKSAKVNFGDGDGFFEYMIDKSGETVRLRSRVKLNRTTFMPEEYNDLREFFSYIVKKHAEPIVLKKKK
ncbi:MAG: DUF3857 domain-containing protein [Chitinophagaceae bacterium]|nr:DUF3857 domain-containing protein [Chitinophagaceae bacterium]